MIKTGPCLLVRAAGVQDQGKTTMTSPGLCSADRLTRSNGSRFSRNLQRKTPDIEIRTVITATEDEQDKIVSHIEQVNALTEDDVFSVPENIDLFSKAPYGDVITYPVSE